MGIPSKTSESTSRDEERQGEHEGQTSEEKDRSQERPKKSVFQIRDRDDPCTQVSPSPLFNDTESDSGICPPAERELPFFVEIIGIVQCEMKLREATPENIP